MDRDLVLADPLWRQALARCDLHALPKDDHPALPDLVVRTKYLAYAVAEYPGESVTDLRALGPTLFDLAQSWEYWDGKEDLPHDPQSRAMFFEALERSKHREPAFYGKYDWQSPRELRGFRMRPSFPDEHSYHLGSELAQIVIACFRQAGKSAD